MTTLRRILTVLAAVALTATGCQTFGWAHHACHHHGGLNHVGKIGNSYIAKCNDGTWHS